MGLDALLSKRGLKTTSGLSIDLPAKQEVTPHLQRAPHVATLKPHLLSKKLS